MGLRVISDRLGTPPDMFAGLSGKASPPSEVVSYMLSPEEMAERLCAIGITGVPKRVKKPMTSFNEEAAKRKGTDEMPKITREQYLQGCLDGKSRSQIYQEFGVNPRAFYELLGKWEFMDRAKEMAAIRAFAGVGLTPTEAPTGVLVKKDDVPPEPVAADEGDSTGPVIEPETAKVDAKGNVVGNSVDNSPVTTNRHITLSFDLTLGTPDVPKDIPTKMWRGTREDVLRFGLAWVQLALQDAAEELHELLGAEMVGEHVQAYVDRIMA